MQRSGYTFNRARVIPAAVVVVLALVGSLLPYLTLGYENFASERIRPTHALWPGADLMRRVDLLYLTAGPGVTLDQLQRAVDVFVAGATAQQIGVVVSVLTLVGLFKDEMNKFFWWPLHLSGWLLCLGAVGVLVGSAMLRDLGVDVVLGPGWAPLAVAGVVVLILTFRSRSRIDSYRGI
jgi:hypothetical protein